MGETTTILINEQKIYILNVEKIPMNPLMNPLMNSINEFHYRNKKNLNIFMTQEIQMVNKPNDQQKNQNVLITNYLK